MKVFTYSQFRQQLSSILDLARREGLVMIKRKDGSFFKVSAVVNDQRSPLDVPSIKTKATMVDILVGIRESRER